MKSQDAKNAALSQGVGKGRKFNEGDQKIVREVEGYSQETV